MPQLKILLSCGKTKNQHRKTNCFSLLFPNITKKFTTKNFFYFIKLKISANSSAVGSGNHAGGYNSSVFGSNSSTYGAYSVAVGYDNISAVEGASTFGVSNRAGFYRYEDGTEYIGGNYASAMGYDNDAFSYSSVAVGYGNIVGDEVDPDSANGGSAIGSNNRVYSPSATAVGISNTVGNTENPELARYASAIGGYNEAYGEESSGIGQENEAYGMTSSAVGAYNRAHGRLSVAMGTSSVAYTDHSVALGINAQAGVKDSTEATSALAIGLGEAEYDEDGYFGYDDEWHPIITGGAVSAENYINPVPAGLVLTGIVVSVSVTAFLLSLTTRLYAHYHTLDIDRMIAMSREEA